MTHKDFLFEIGCEELPPKALKKLSQALVDAVSKALDDEQFNFKEIDAYATPRRLAFKIKDLTTQQADREVKKQGPFVSAAFDDNGNATPAGAGFARSCGVSIEELQREQTNKGERLYFETIETGKAVNEVLPEIIQKALKKLPIPKMMRWGAGKECFVRPVHWVVMLLGDEVLSAEFFGITSGRVSQGHRFLNSDNIELKNANAIEYEQQLEKAYVIVDFDARRKLIEDKLIAIAKQENVNIEINKDLLDEVTALVEWPVPLLCEFDKEFLQVPKEALIASMADHQKYFHLTDGNGDLVSKFITVSNIDSTNPDTVRQGNACVVRARLNDAAFFYQSDCQHPLTDFIPKLAEVTYHKKLGSLQEKSERLVKLSQLISERLDVDSHVAKRVAALAKCDLLTLMVGEFPELQGVMGNYYARQAGEDAAVAQAIEEQYLPRFANDKVPASPYGNIIALAERLDKLVSIFGLNEIPSGEKDPYALRRAALGVVRIIIENQLSLNVIELLEASQQTFALDLPNADVVNQVHQFIIERMKTWYAESHDISHDIFAAVCARENSHLMDMHQRLCAVKNFRQLESALALAAANKRVSRILIKEGKEDFSQPIQQELLQLAEEKKLAEVISDKKNQLSPLFAAGKYNEALQELADLREPIDLFFDNVMVMVDEDDLRNNRLALLIQLRELFLEVADISLLQ